MTCRRLDSLARAHAPFPYVVDRLDGSRRTPRSIIHRPFPLDTQAKRSPLLRLNTFTAFDPVALKSLLTSYPIVRGASRLNGHAAQPAPKDRSPRFKKDSVLAGRGESRSVIQLASTRRERGQASKRARSRRLQSMNQAREREREEERKKEQTWKSCGRGRGKVAAIPRCKVGRLITRLVRIEARAFVGASRAGTKLEREERKRARF